MCAFPGRYIYGFSEYDGGVSDATHEIEVHWPTGFTPPIVLPVGAWLHFDSDAPEELQGSWRIVAIHSYQDYKGDGFSILCYLVNQ